MTVNDKDAPRGGEGVQPSPGDDEVSSLNADDLDVSELDEELLEEVAGGAGCLGFDCDGYCATHMLE